MKASTFPYQFRKLNKVFLALCFAAVLLLVAGDRQTATAQQPEEGHVGHFTKGPPTRVQVPLLSKPPEVKPEELDRMEKAIEQLHQTRGGTTPIGPNAKVRQGPPAIPEVKPKDPGLPEANPLGGSAAGSMRAPKSSAGIAWYTGTDLSSGPARSPTNEPSADFNGAVGLVTYNKYAAMTQDWGISWVYMDPTTIITPVFQGGVFCCDQDVLHDPSRDLTFWSQLSLPDSQQNISGSTLGVAYAIGESNLRSGVWQVLYFAPSDISSCSPQAGDWFDYPHLARSNNFLYIVAKIYPSGNGFRCAFMLRISLDQLAAGGTLNIDTYSIGGNETSFQPVYGATDTMYFARHVNTTSMRIYTWSESMSAPAVTDISHASYISSPKGSYICTTPNGSNPCGYEDDKLMTGYLANGIAGFLWNVPQGTDGLGSFNYPHVRVLRVNVNNMSAAEDTALYNQSIAYMYPSLHPNSRGDLGGTMAFAGGGYHPGCFVMIHDWNNASSFTDTDIYTMQTGTGSVPPTDTLHYNRWGDYLNTRLYPAFFDGKAWLGTCYAYQYTPATITPEIVRFNRPSDSARWHDRDFMTDGKADLAIWRPSNGTFYWLNSTTDYADSGLGSQQLGLNGDWPLLADFDRDLQADVAVWRPSNATFYWMTWDRDIGPVLNSRQFGIAGDWPLLGDLDGDRYSDLVIWRSKDGIFYSLTSSTGYSVTGSKFWGTAGDWPMLADVDGDSKADLCVWRPSDGTFNCLLSSTGYDSGFPFFKQFGGNVNGDWPLMADIDGDGKADLCLWDTWSGYGFTCLVSIANYNTMFAYSKVWGETGDWPLLADMDGDGKADFVVYRPLNNTFFWLTSSSGYNSSAYRYKTFGSTGDQVPSVNYPIPTATNLNPASAKAGGSAFWLTVNGANFVNGAKVRWNGSDRTTTFNGATTLTAYISAADIASTGTANVTVFNPAPGGGESFGLTFTIGKTPTILALIASKLTARAGESVSFVAFLTPNPYAPALQSTAVTPTGTITFKDSTTPLATVNVDASGAAAYTTASLAVGTHSITAVYSGDANLLGSTSNTLTETIAPNTLDLPLIVR